MILQARLRAAIDRLNPHIPAEAREDAFKKACARQAPDRHRQQRSLPPPAHRRRGCQIRRRRGQIAAPIRSGWWILTIPKNNEFLAVNQFTVVENNTNKRPDIVLFINGLPLVVIELKNAADENADVQAAFHQLQTYQQVIPSLFTYQRLSRSSATAGLPKPAPSPAIIPASWNGKASMACTSWIPNTSPNWSR